MRLDTMPSSKRFPIVPILLVAMAALPQTAYANAIIPYLWVPVAQVFLFPVVVLAEAWLLSRWLKTAFWPTAGKCLVANLASTVVGAVIYFSSMPLIGEPLWNFWRQYETPAAAALSLAFGAVLFMISWVVEAAIFTPWSRAIPRKVVWRYVGYSNAATYACLLTLSLFSL
jgi:hypothetical protein